MYKKFYIHYVNHQNKYSRQNRPTKVNIKDKPRTLASNSQNTKKVLNEKIELVNVIKNDLY